jgi:hypothetical protein
MLDGLCCWFHLFEYSSFGYAAFSFLSESSGGGSGVLFYSLCECLMSDKFRQKGSLAGLAGGEKWEKSKYETLHCKL